MRSSSIVMLCRQRAVPAGAGAVDYFHYVHSVDYVVVAIWRILCQCHHKF